MKSVTHLTVFFPTWSIKSRLEAPGKIVNITITPTIILCNLCIIGLVNFVMILNVKPQMVEVIFVLITLYDRNGILTFF